jgi:RNA ligase
MFKDKLKEFVNANPKLVSMKPAGDGIYVLKYKKKVFYDNLWNDFLEECRGTIVDENFNIVSRPFTKVYNYGVEDKSPVLSDDTPVVAYRKVNGFMVALTWHNDSILVSTTGSTDSDYVRMAKEIMLKHQSWANWESVIGQSPGWTYMFECVHPEDPHIIVEKEGMYLLGWRENSWDSCVDGFHLPTQWRDVAEGVLNCYYAEAFVTTMGKLISHSKRVQHEGFVFYTKDGVSAKIKSPYYLTSKWVARNPRTDKLVDLNKDIKHNLDEEYYPLVDAIRANIVEYTAMDEQARLVWVRKYMETV